jgi:cellulose synthase (UDP-forming)
VTVQSLPRPPGVEEKYWFLGRQHRWLMFVQALSFLGVGYSMYKFAHLSDWTLICVMPLGVYFLELALAFRTTLFRRKVYQGDHDMRVRQWIRAHNPGAGRTDGADAAVAVPSVDVYLPTAGEDIDVLNNTYTYVKEILWPGRLTTYVLDDAGRPEVAALARKYGFEYIHRIGSEFKKAGNLNNAFHLTDGDFIMLFDADFVPRSDIVINLIPYMEDAAVGIVQSPQVFDTTKQMNWLERGAGATQELFYRFIQPSRDAVGAAICVGTSALYRRAALETVGGYPLIDHSEDMYTGISIKNEGYSTRYVPVILSRGTCPDTLNSFVMQQYRWCEGSLHMLTDPIFHRNRNLTLTQRMSFWAGILYYLTTAMNAFLGPLPVLIILIWYPANVNPSSMVLLLGPLVMWFVIYPLIFKYRWRLEVLRVQMIYSYTHAVTFWHMLKQTYVEWVPTGGKSTATPLVTTVRRLLKYYALGTQVVLVVFLAIDSARFGVERYWLTGVFAVLNLYVVGPVIVLAWRTSAAGESPWPARLRRLVHEPVVAIYLKPAVARLARVAWPVAQPTWLITWRARSAAPVAAPAWLLRGSLWARHYLDRPIGLEFARRVPAAVVAVGHKGRGQIQLGRRAAAAVPAAGAAVRVAGRFVSPTERGWLRLRKRVEITARTAQLWIALRTWKLRAAIRTWRSERRFERPEWLDSSAGASAEAEMVQVVEP